MTEKDGKMHCDKCGYDMEKPKCGKCGGEMECQCGKSNDENEALEEADDDTDAEL
jgi:hypothetical protein